VTGPSISRPDAGDTPRSDPLLDDVAPLDCAQHLVGPALPVERQLGNPVDQDRREGLSLDVSEKRPLVPAPRPSELGHLEGLEEDRAAVQREQPHVLVGQHDPGRAMDHLKQMPGLLALLETDVGDRTVRRGEDHQGHVQREQQRDRGVDCPAGPLPGEQSPDG